MNLSCTLHLKIILLLATICQLGGKLEGAYGSKPEGDSGSGSKLEGALLLVDILSEILN